MARPQRMLDRVIRLSDAIEILTNSMPKNIAHMPKATTENKLKIHFGGLALNLLSPVLASEDAPGVPDSENGKMSAIQSLFASQTIDPTTDMQYRKSSPRWTTSRKLRR